jgi:hypothetical protein
MVTLNVLILLADTVHRGQQHYKGESIVAFPWQVWLRERATFLSDTYSPIERS